MHKITSGSAPQYMNQLFMKNENLSSRSTAPLRPPRPRIDLYKTSIAYSGSLLWNSLPTSLTQTASRNIFKKDLFKYLTEQVRPP